VGYSAVYNTLDNNRAPTQGVLVEFKQDLAGVGGDVHNVKSTIDARMYNEIFPEIVGVLRGQAGWAVGWDGGLRMLDHFQAGPSLVRGFQPAGFGPRDISQIVYGYAGAQDALGGSLYWASSLEFQTPLPFVPKDFGMKIALFSDAGLLWDYRGPTYWNQTGESLALSESNIIRSSVGAGLIWDSPFGPLRFDLAYALTKGPYDKTQIFRFGGGTRF
jgi:outer membrane protein insertion porin family